MKTIAIIDDDIHIGDMLREVLVQEGYSVLRAYSGTEALYLLSQNKPDLVLLDLMLPGLSGEEVLPHIENIPVIVLSAKVDVQDKVNLLLGGAADYMTKPFDTKELLARITVQLRKAEQHGETKSLSVGDLVLDLIMKKYLKEILILLIQLFMFYVFPLFAGPTDVMGMIVLLILATLLLSILIGSISNLKVKYLYPIIIAITFVPSVFIYYNETALIHSLWYLAVSSFGLIIGMVIHKLILKK